MVYATVLEAVVERHGGSSPLLGTIYGMKTKSEIITEMCLAYRPDYDTVLGVEDNDFGVGVTPWEREKIRSIMAKIYDQVIVPNIDSVKKLGD